METSYEDTQDLIETVLTTLARDVTKVLDYELKLKQKTLPQFYDGVIKHGPKMKLTARQWFDFHCKVRHWRLLEEKSLMDKLSPRQREELGAMQNPK